MTEQLIVADYDTCKKLDYFKVRQQLVALAASSIGKRMANELLPISATDIVVERQAETSEALYLLRMNPEVPLNDIVDVADLLSHVNLGGHLEAIDFLSIQRHLHATRSIYHYICEANQEKDTPVLKEIALSLSVFDFLENEIKAAITNEGEVRDSASETLKKLRRNIFLIRQEIRTQVENLLKNNDFQPYFQEQIVTVRNDRYVLAVKQEHRQKVPGIVHDQSASGATLYVEPIQVVGKNNQLKQLELDEIQEVKRILIELSGLIKPYVNELMENLELLGSIDLAFAKAKFSKRLNAISPFMDETASFEFKQARHPLLPQGEVVPIDIKLNHEVQSLIITGPNTGGKTVTLKTVGLLILMHQSGLHLPVDSGSTIGIFRHVFADIGDEQSIEQSLSTFSSHLTNITRILSKLNEDSIVLYDELGAGTDPAEGAALAVAILENSLAKGSKVLATTHYNDLKTFSYEHQRVQNASVEFDIKSLKPTYRLLIGIAGNSNAFNIARRIGLDEEVVQRAQVIADERISNAERALRSLEDEKSINAGMKIALEQKEIELNRKIIMYEKKLNDLEERKEAILNHTKEKAAALLTEARIEAERSVKELKALRKAHPTESSQKARSIQRQLSSRVGHLRKKEERQQQPVNPRDIVVGQDVYLTEYDQLATVLEKPSKNGEVQVQAGVIKMTVSLNKISLSKGKTNKQELASKKKSQQQAVKNFSPEIDIRGKYLDDALIRVEKFLDEAFLMGIKEVQIIHGKGTGALRSGIRQMLKNNSHVEGYRTGTFHEGGDGVTVVEIR